MNWDAQDNGDERSHFGHWNISPLLSPSLSSHRQYFWMQIKLSQQDLQNMIWLSLCFACQIQHPFMSMHKWVMVEKDSDWTEWAWCDLSVTAKLQRKSYFLYIFHFCLILKQDEATNQMDFASIIWVTFSHSIPHNPSFFPYSWRSLLMHLIAYVAHLLTNAIAISLLILRWAALSSWDFKTPMYTAGLILYWHTFHHSSWSGTALHRHNIEQRDIVCKGSCDIIGYRQSHWWTKAHLL